MFNDTLYECPGCHSTNILERELSKMQTVFCACGEAFSHEEGFCLLLRSSDTMVLGAVTSHTVLFDELTIKTHEPIPIKLPQKIWRVKQILTEPSEEVDTCFVDHEGFSIVVSKENLAKSSHNVKVEWFAFANLSPPSVLWQKLLGDAFEYHFKETFDISIIYAITALDTELSEFTRWLTVKGDRASLGDKMKAFTQAIGESERINLKQLLDSTWTSIKLRNKLIHNRRELETHSITWHDSIETITTVYRVIKEIHRIIGR